MPGSGSGARFQHQIVHARVKNDSETSSSSPVFVPVPGFCHAIRVQDIGIPARPQSHIAVAAVGLVKNFRIEEEHRRRNVGRSFLWGPEAIHTGTMLWCRWTGNGSESTTRAATRAAQRRVGYIRARGAFHNLRAFLLPRIATRARGDHIRAVFIGSPAGPWRLRDVHRSRMGAQRSPPLQQSKG